MAAARRWMGVGLCVVIVALLAGSLGQRRAAATLTARDCLAAPQNCEGRLVAASYLDVLRVGSKDVVVRYGTSTLQLVGWPADIAVADGSQVSAQGRWSGAADLVVERAEHHPARVWKERVGALALMLWLGLWAVRLRRGAPWPTS